MTSRALALTGAFATALVASAAAASPIARVAAERAVRDHAALGKHDLAIGDARRFELGETLTHNGVSSDVEIRQVTLLTDGHPLTGVNHLLHPDRTVALAEGDDGQAELLADRKGAKPPAASNHPSLRYAWKSVKKSPFAKGAMVADGLMYAGLGAAALFTPHLLAAAAIANVVESVGEKTAYGVSLWRAQPKIRAQHEAVDEVAAFVTHENAAGRTVDFSDLYARYQKNVADKPAVPASDRLDAFQLRDWLAKSLAGPQARTDAPKQTASDHQ